MKNETSTLDILETHQASKVFVIDVGSLTFTDRATYLQWAASWKSAYRTKSALIRRLKAENRQAQREHGWTLSENLCRQFRSEAALATQMLEVRGASKVKAQEQFKASLPLKT